MKQCLLISAGVVLVLALGAGYVLWPCHVDGEVISAELAVDHRTRDYRLVVPRQRGSTKMPLVFAFHGATSTPEDLAGNSHLDCLASDEHFLLVYPAADHGVWQALGSSPAPPAENADLEFFDRLLTHLAAHYPVDRQRVYVVGMSNGASFAQFVALHRSEQIAAAVAHSGILPESQQGVPELPVPIMLLVGSDDSSSLIEATRAESRRYQEEGIPAQLIEIHGWGHDWFPGLNPEMWAFLSSHKRETNSRGR